MEIDSIRYRTLVRNEALHGEYIKEHLVTVFGSNQMGLLNTVAQARCFNVQVDRFKRMTRKPVIDLFHTRYELLPFCTCLYTSDGDIRSDVLRKTQHETLSNDLFVIERIEVLPELRHTGLAVTTLRSVMNHLANWHELITLRLTPLQTEDISPRDTDPRWKKRMGYQRMTKVRSEAISKLEQIFLNMGFVSLSDEIMGNNHTNIARVLDDKDVIQHPYRLISMISSPDFMESHIDFET